MTISGARREEAAGVLRLGEPDADSVAQEAWESIPTLALDHRHLARNRIVSLARRDRAHVAFDLLRTRLIQALRARGWTRVAITSPTKACGKTFVAANLALSIARRQSCRAVVFDLDLRIPNLARVLGLRDVPRAVDFLAGQLPMQSYLRRVASNLAIGSNREPVIDSAELIQEPSTAAVLAAVRTILRPDVVLYDLPPALVCDDVIAFLPQVDGVLLVASGGTTSAQEVRECERLFAGQAPLLGVILNKSEDPVVEPYYS